jgi:hypothetical protein
MLANGAKLGYKEKDSEGSTFTDLKGLKELPDIGTDPEKVDNTTLTDKVKQYENGIGDVGDMKYKFKYDNTKSDSPYRVMRKYAEDGTTLTFQETTKDGTITQFDAQVSVKRTGGGVNGVIEFELGMSLQSGFTWTDPE